MSLYLKKSLHIAWVSQGNVLLNPRNVLLGTFPGPKTGIIAKLHPLWCYFWRHVSNGAGFCDRGREARRDGREVGDEGAGSGDRGGGKWGSSTPLSTPQDIAFGNFDAI